MTAGAYEFELSGGRVCLDFANTVSGRVTGGPVDHLASYADVLGFTRQAGVLSSSAARGLGAVAAERPRDARAALERAVAVREAIYRVFLAVAEGSRPARADVGILNEALPEALSRLRLIEAARDAPPAGAPCAWGWESPDEELVAPLAPLLRSAGPPHVTGSEPGAGLRAADVRVVVPGHQQEPEPPLVRHESLRQPRQGPAPLCPHEDGGLSGAVGHSRGNSTCSRSAAEKRRR